MAGRWDLAGHLAAVDAAAAAAQAQRAAAVLRVHFGERGCAPLSLSIISLAAVLKPSGPVRACGAEALRVCGARARPEALREGRAGRSCLLSRRSGM